MMMRGELKNSGRKTLKSPTDLLRSADGGLLGITHGIHRLKVVPQRDTGNVLDLQTPSGDEMDGMMCRRTYAEMPLVFVPAWDRSR